MGIVASSTWQKDPKRLLFTLARYKFVAKMLEGIDNVLEIGCGDAWASRIVKQHVGELTAVDLDIRFINSAETYSTAEWKINLLVADITQKINQLGIFDAVYLLDVLEHISTEDELLFFDSLKALMSEAAVLIVGMPTLRSQDLIPEEKRDKGHVNCKHPLDLKSYLKIHFKNVFIFSMNDELVHTGHHAMAHYVFALCCGKNESK
jgi:2-polyprenyl-3-methyl-5-hydroxy-6-metoxy-1,4-benzoquinol methylase